MVNVVCPTRYKINRRLIKLTINEFLLKLGIPAHFQLNIIFVGRNKMKTVAKKYKDEKIALPVLSFAYDQDKDNLFGEIFICYPQAVLLAAERNKKVDYIIENLIKHGIENILKN